MLRRCLKDTPVPVLPPDFNRRTMRGLRRPDGRYRQILFAGYGLVSAVTSATVLRGQDLGWWIVAVAILGPLAPIVAFQVARGAARARRG